MTHVTSDVGAPNREAVRRLVAELERYAGWLGKDAQSARVRTSVRGLVRAVAVERPARRVVALVLCITVCSALDALFMLLYVSDGWREGNPLAALFLTYGPTTFVSFKMGVTCAAVWIIAALHQWLPLSAYLVLYGLALFYLALIGAYAAHL